MTKIINANLLFQFHLEGHKAQMAFWSFENSNFDIVSNFEFRASNLLIGPLRKTK